MTTDRRLLERSSKVLVYAYNAENMAITGEGVIDGIDFDGCSHVRVSDSHFKTGDDCLSTQGPGIAKLP